MLYDILAKMSRTFRAEFNNAYELLNLRALTFSPANKMHIFQCVGKIVCVEFHTEYLTHALKGAIFIQRGNFESS